MSIGNREPETNQPAIKHLCGLPMEHTMRGDDIVRDTNRERVPKSHRMSDRNDVVDDILMIDGAPCHNDHGLHRVRLQTRSMICHTSTFPDA